MRGLVGFVEKITLADGGCWEWGGTVMRNGYGAYARTTAHRWGYRAMRGGIPDGADLDHLCRNRRCVNPDHLEPVSRSENLRRGYAARGSADACAQGHQFTAENTGTNSVSGHRYCKECSRGHKRAYKARVKAATAAITTGSDLI